MSSVRNFRLHFAVLRPINKCIWGFCIKHCFRRVCECRIYYGRKILKYSLQKLDS